MDISNSVNQNNAYVAYTKAIYADSTYRILLKRKLANKTTFETTSTRVSPDSLVSSLFPSIDVDNQGNIHVLFMSSTVDAPNLSMYYTRSADAGLTFSKPIKISDIQIPHLSPNQATGTITGFLPNRIYPCPQIKVDNSLGIYTNRVYAVWAANGTDRRLTEGMDIYLSYSSDNGATWTIPKVVNDDKNNTKAEQFHPTLSVTPNGIVAITWYDRRDDANNAQTRYYSAISKNGGILFEQNKTISTQAADFSVIGQSNASFGIGEYNATVSTKNFLIPFWCDGRNNNGNIEVYTALIPLSNTVSTDIVEVKTLSAGFTLADIYPNPTQDDIVVNVDCLSSISECLIRITDEQGKIVHQEKRLGLLSGQQQWTINIRNFSKGTYVCSVISSKGIMSKNFIIAR